MLFSLIILAIFVDAVFYGIIIPILPASAKNNGISPEILCFIFAFYPISMLVFSLPLGILADRLGRRLLMTGGMCLMVVSMVFFIKSDTTPGFLAGRFLQGIAAAATWTAGLAWICDIYPPEKRGEKFGLAVVASGVGMFIGPVLGGILSEQYGNEAAFMVCMLAALALAIVFLLLRIPKAQIVKTNWSAIPWADPGLWLSCSAIALGIAGLGLFEPLLPLYIMDRFQASQNTVGLLFGAMCLTYIATQPLFGKLSDRYGRKRFIILGFFMMAAGTPLILWADSLTWIFVIGGFLGIAMGLLITPAAALLSEVFTKHSAAYGISASFFNIALSVGLALGPLLGGGLYKYWDFSGVFLVYTGLMAISGITAQFVLTKSIRYT